MRGDFIVLQFTTMLAVLLSLHRTPKLRGGKALYGWVPKADKWQGTGESARKPLIPRQGENSKNYVASWQSEGDYYVSYDNLLKLDAQLTSFTKGRTKSEKTELLSELSNTYFARLVIMMI